MFRSWEITLKREELQPEHTLRVVFPSIVEGGIKAREALGYPLPSPNDAGTHPISPFVRKAPYQFGWDWGPRAVTQGIWKGVSLQAWDDWRLTGVRIRQDSLTAEAAFGQAIYTVESHQEQALHLLLAADGQPLANTTAHLNEGTQEMALPFVLENPEWWWPKGWGGARLYSLEASITARSGQTQSQRKNFGFRTLELDRQPDSIGTRFTIRVNGQPLFAKGANCIPQSLFPGSVSPDNYLRLLTDAHRSHFNMLRVWGGGIYEHDRFYDLCDSLGILVWQDFMFAGAMYPSDSAFLANVQAEAMEHVARLSDHPSVALWCGNNEVDVAWHNWGWQQQFGYSAEQQAAIKRGYDQLFKHILPNAV
ncbi:MAG: glycoside hydrolase family 2 protein, partial [Bacteroidota bacterium]